VIAMIVWWIILWWWSLIIIQKNLNISFDRLFFIKNLAIISLCSGALFFIKERFLIIDDIARWNNIRYLLVAMLLYYIILAGVNHKDIRMLVKEIKSIKK
jgi:hypothetical protein